MKPIKIKPQYWTCIKRYVSSIGENTNDLIYHFLDKSIDKTVISAENKCDIIILSFCFIIWSQMVVIFMIFSSPRLFIISLAIVILQQIDTDLAAFKNNSTSQAVEYCISGEIEWVTKIWNRTPPDEGISRCVEDPFLALRCFLHFVRVFASLTHFPF